MKVTVDIPDSIDLSKVNDVKLYLKYYKNNNEYSYVTEGFVIQEERPQGEWVYNDKWTDCRCSVCGKFSDFGTSNFCPNCGADLRGKAE